MKSHAEKVELVAKIISESANVSSQQSWTMPWDELDGHVREAYRRIARRILQALSGSGLR
jgi:hypothetical protein